jgi:hypothetical protein
MGQNYLDEVVLALWKIMPTPLTPKQPMFHYTSLSGFRGIISKKDMWATDISYLNDTREFTCAIDAVAERMKERSSESVVLNAFAERLPQIKFRLPNSGPYVISFSLREDSLSQWRGYCGAGAGISLGFDPTFLHELTISVKAKEKGFPRPFYVFTCPVYLSSRREERIN